MDVKKPEERVTLPEGRVTLPDGRIVSARLNIAKLLKQDTAEAGTIDDVIEAAGLPTGGRRKMRGGVPSETATEVRNIIEAAKAAGAGGAAAVDKMTASMLRLSKAAVPVAATVFAVKNVSVFGGLVATTRDFLADVVVTSSSGQTYADIGKEVIKVASQFIGFGKDAAAYAQNSPEFAVALASSIMFYRAASNNTSVVGQIKADAASVASAASKAFSEAARGVTGVAQSFNDAYEAEAKKKVADTLREIGMRVVKTPGEGSAPTSAQVTQGAPAFQGPVKGKVVVGMRGVSGYVTKPPSTALEQLTGVSKTGKRGREGEGADLSTEAAKNEGAMDVEGARALADLATGPAADLATGPAAKKPKTDGGRRRKTKKRVTKKRRVTRRRMPTFSY